MSDTLGEVEAPGTGGTGFVKKSSGLDSPANGRGTPSPPRPSTPSPPSSDGDAPLAVQPSYSGLRRKHADEDITMPEWRAHSKHVFVLSHAGRPVYVRYGDESKLAGLIGVMSGLVSFVADRLKDKINVIKTTAPAVMGSAPLAKADRPVTIVFKLMGPLWFVIASRTDESVATLNQQLLVVHSQIISILTGSIHKVLTTKPRTDIRNLLLGTDRLFDQMCSWMNRAAPFLLNSVHGLRISAALRLQLGNVLLSHRRGELFYAILLARGQLVQLLRPRNYILYPPDLHLIMNFVKSRDQTSRSSEAQWSPICLPLFNDKGYLHLFISYLTADVGLLLLSSKIEDFELMRQCNDEVLKDLQTTGLIDTLTQQLGRQYYTTKDVGVDGVLHFLYKSLSTSQMTAPAIGPPYNTIVEQKRLYRLYEHVYRRVHGFAAPTGFYPGPKESSPAPGSPAALLPAAGPTGEGLVIPFTQGPHKVYYHVSEKETVVAWVTAGFELYATFSPLESKAVAIRACNQLLKWIKAEESSLFILDSPVW